MSKEVYQKPQDKVQKSSHPHTQKQSGNTSALQFEDNRPEAVAQRQLQELANNSPQVSQLKTFQDQADNSPQVKQSAQLQAMANNYTTQQNQPIQKKASSENGLKENNTGLPDNLKSGIENLSGYSMDDVKVHYNSDKPAQLQAHAYAQGTDIHLGTGQEKHLPHEAWHVVQQKQGRVKPTMQMKGKVNVNDDVGLEKEADVMGVKSMLSKNQIPNKPIQQAVPTSEIAQRVIKIQSTEKEYSEEAGNLGELATKLTYDPAKYGLRDDFVTKLSQANISIETVLKRLDTQGLTFENKRTLVTRLKQEYLTAYNLNEQSRTLIDDNITPNYHPLVHDTPQGFRSIANLFGQNAPPIREILLESTDQGRVAMETYKQGREKGDSDAILMKSILAALEIHSSGATHENDYSEQELELQQIATAPYGEEVRDQLLNDYGLNKYERRSIVAYSFPHKGDMLVGGKWNQYYMGYSPNNWGETYKDGWAALLGAFQKLPSLGELGLKATVYRASRNDTETSALDKLAPGTEIEHGKQVMNQGQNHFTSTSLTYSVHNHASRVSEAGGMMALHSTSGVYINPFGGFGFLDGGEVLMPPGARTTYTGKRQRGYRSEDTEAPIYHLDERVPVKPYNESVDDFEFQKPKSPLIESENRQKEKESALEKRIEKLAAINTPAIQTLLKQKSITPDNNNSLQFFFVFSSFETKVSLEKELQEAIENSTKTDLVNRINAHKLVFGNVVFFDIYEPIMGYRDDLLALFEPIEKLQAVLDLLEGLLGNELQLITKIDSLAGNEENQTIISEEVGMTGIQYVGEVRLRQILIRIVLRDPQDSFLQNVLRFK